MTRFSLCVTVKFLKETISESADAQDFSIRKEKSYCVIFTFYAYLPRVPVILELSVKERLVKHDCCYQQHQLKLLHYSTDKGVKVHQSLELSESIIISKSSIIKANFLLHCLTHFIFGHASSGFLLFLRLLALCPVRR